MKKEDLMTVGMVARELSLSRERVHNKRRAGHFPSAFQLEDGTWLIERKDLAQNRQPNPAGRPKKASK